MAGARFNIGSATAGTPYTETNTGTIVEINATGENLLLNRGYVANVFGHGLLHYGAFLIAKNAFIYAPFAPSAASNVGGRGIGYSDTFAQPANTNFGLIGEACGGRINIGVYGSDKPTGISDCNSVVADDSYAGYFTGSVVCMEPVITPSDEQLKMEIEPITNASELLAQLQPKTYQYKVDEFPYLSLAEGLQYGLISQEVEEVLPSVVRTFYHPAFYDTTGQEVTPEVVIKGMKYTDLIPLLIAGFNEQQAEMEAKQAEIETLESKLAELQAQMTEVVKSVENALLHGSLSPQSNPEKGASGNTLGQNVPNPFTDQTRVDFSLTHQAQVRLEVSDAQGRIIDVLIDGQLSDGLHSIMINGNKYTPGLYYYSLYANGELLTKKMIKR